MSYRFRIFERDFAGFVLQTNPTRGGTVIRTRKGPLFPTLVTSEGEYITNYAKPNATYWEGFEALDYVKLGNPLWIMRPIGTGYAHAGVDITSTSIVPFGTRTGRIPAAIDYAAINTNAVDKIGTGDGIVALYTGTLANVPIDEGTLIVKINGTTLDVTEAGGTLSGTDVSAGTLDKATGAYSITFAGVAGTVASYTSSVDLAGTPIDLTALPKALAFNLSIDGVLYENISTGTTDASYTNADLVITINTAVGSTVAAVDGGGGVTISGLIGDTTNGGITIEDPTDITTYGSGVTDLFDATFVEGASNSITEDTAATNPTGTIPGYGEDIVFDYIYNVDSSLTVSHSFYYTSPHEDDVDPIAINVTHLTGTQYQATLYKVDAVKGNSLVEGFPVTYSLTDEKDASGKSIYIEDIFDESHPYLTTTVNSAYVGTALPIVSTEVTFTGGTEGTAPLDSDYTTAWDYFKQIQKYPAKLVMDMRGLNYVDIQNIVENYQVYSHAFFPVPRGNTASQAVTYRQGLGISSDRMSIYWNWSQIRDPYNNSKAWTSNIGKISGKLALQAPIFDGGKSAGADEGPYGGQLKGFQILKFDYDPTDTDLENFDGAQINPFVFDPVFGPVAWGDRTMLSVTTDTSYIPTRRAYNYLKKKVYEDVLRQQLFAFNDATHREIAAQKAREIVNPMLNAGVIAEALVVCDSTNNGPDILQARNFVITIRVKATPTSEFVNLYIDRLSQTQSLSDF